jgi:hypothetical protein
MAPTPVATRVPQPTETADTINGFLRVEAGGGAIMGNQVLFNASIILHSYASNNQESLAEQLMVQAIAYGSNAQGCTIVHPSSAIPYFICFSTATALAMKQEDPLVNLVRFRAMVTWRLQGVPVSTPVTGGRLASSRPGGQGARTTGSHTPVPPPIPPGVVRTPSRRRGGGRK